MDLLRENEVLTGLMVDVANTRRIIDFQLDAVEDFLEDDVEYKQDLVMDMKELSRLVTDLNIKAVKLKRRANKELDAALNNKMN